MKRASLVLLGLGFLGIVALAYEWYRRKQIVPPEEGATPEEREAWEQERRTRAEEEYGPPEPTDPQAFQEYEYGRVEIPIPTPQPTVKPKVTEPSAPLTQIGVREEYPIAEYPEPRIGAGGLLVVR